MTSYNRICVCCKATPGPKEKIRYWYTSTGASDKSQILCGKCSRDKQGLGTGPKSDEIRLAHLTEKAAVINNTLSQWSVATESSFKNVAERAATVNRLNRTKAQIVVVENRIRKSSEKKKYKLETRIHKTIIKKDKLRKTTGPTFKKTEKKLQKSLQQLEIFNAHPRTLPQQEFLFPEDAGDMLMNLSEQIRIEVCDNESNPAYAGEKDQAMNLVVDTGDLGSVNIPLNQDDFDVEGIDYGFLNQILADSQQQFQCSNEEFNCFDNCFDEINQPRSPVAEINQPRSPVAEINQPRSPVAEIMQPRSPVTSCFDNFSTEINQLCSPSTEFNCFDNFPTELNHQVTEFDRFDDFFPNSFSLKEFQSELTGFPLDSLNLNILDDL